MAAAASFLFLSLLLLPRPAEALALSRGFQTLPIGYAECLARAYQAMRAEGYSATPSTGDSFVGGFKGQHGAYITCGLGPTQQAEVNVFVATEGTRDSNVPGNERVRLQQRMNMAVAPPPIAAPTPPPGPPPVAQGGGWTGWLNRDDPGASADYEALAEFSSQQVPCKQPTAVECRVVSDKRDWRLTGQRYSCTLAPPNPGGVCVNAENPGGCLDYEVRFFCPGGATSAQSMTPALVPPPVATAAAPQYLGCFRDTNNPLDLSGTLQRSTTNTPQRCIQSCAAQGFPFAGVQYGESCLCGNSYGRYGPATNCDMRCTGDGSLACGGINANNVYSTGVRR